MNYSFELGGMHFEYDTNKNETNKVKHGISLQNAARIFFDYDRIEMTDSDNEFHELRYDTIGDLSAGKLAIGNISDFSNEPEDILFVVYQEYEKSDDKGNIYDVTRLISARLATNFERGIYYGKY